METAFVLEVLGETRGLLPASAPLYGEDEESCLLSEDMAYKLFGSKDVMGREILYRGRNSDCPGEDFKGDGGDRSRTGSQGGRQCP